MKERLRRFLSPFSVHANWTRGRKAFMYLVFIVLAVALLVCICKPSACLTPTPVPTPTPDPTPPQLPSKAEVEAELPEMWFEGISWQLMLSRINERFPETDPRTRFVSGAKYMALDVREGKFFVAPGHKLLPWPPA